MKIAILTESRYEHPPAGDPYIERLLLEDRLVAEAIVRRGAEVIRVDWARADVDWKSLNGAVFRSTWDYFDRFAEFSAWLDRVEPLVPLANSAAIVRWNAEKRYLIDLQKAGVTIVETELLPRGDSRLLAEVMEHKGWSEAILKPAVSGAARLTHRLDRSAASALESQRRIWNDAEDFLLQPFEPAILAEGELSLMVIGGEFTHAVRKIAKPGDFRVQDDHGGTVHDYRPTNDEIAFAERAVAACPQRPEYARVDLVRNREGLPAIMELELIEPEMFFRFAPDAADRFAERITAYFQRS